MKPAGRVHYTDKGEFRIVQATSTHRRLYKHNQVNISMLDKGVRVERDLEAATESPSTALLASFGYMLLLSLVVVAVVTAIGLLLWRFYYIPFYILIWVCAALFQYYRKRIVRQLGFRRLLTGGMLLSYEDYRGETDEGWLRWKIDDIRLRGFVEVKAKNGILALHWIRMLAEKKDDSAIPQDADIYAWYRESKF